MIPWIRIIRGFGFFMSYVKCSDTWTFGFIAGFEYKDFYIELGLKPSVRKDFIL
jgi:hypothetical protein